MYQGEGAYLEYCYLIYLFILGFNLIMYWIYSQQLYRRECVFINQIHSSVWFLGFDPRHIVLIMGTYPECALCSLVSCPPQLGRWASRRGHVPTAARASREWAGLSVLDVFLFRPQTWWELCWWWSGSLDPSDHVIWVRSLGNLYEKTI